MFLGTLPHRYVALLPVPVQNSDFPKILQILYVEGDFFRKIEKRNISPQAFLNMFRNHATTCTTSLLAKFYHQARSILKKLFCELNEVSHRLKVQRHIGTLEFSILQHCIQCRLAARSKSANWTYFASMLVILPFSNGWIFKSTSMLA